MVSLFHCELSNNCTAARELVPRAGQKVVDPEERRRRHVACMAAKVFMHGRRRLCEHVILGPGTMQTSSLHIVIFFLLASFPFLDS
jgi:hypothetical protein